MPQAGVGAEPTEGWVKCPCKAGGGPIPSHRHLLAVPSPALQQHGSGHMPGGDIHPAWCSQPHHLLVSWTVPQWRLGLSCQPLSLLSPQVPEAAAPDVSWSS